MTAAEATAVRSEILESTAQRATNLTDTQLRELRAVAAPRFADPAQLQRVQRFIAGRSDWATAITGQPFNGVRSLTMAQVAMLDHAASLEPNPPKPPVAPPAPKQPAPSQRHLLDALPVAAAVAHNFQSHRHLDTYTQGAEHIIVLEPLNVGRLHRRAGQALCETPSRAQQMQFPNVDLEQREDREPTCKACLRLAQHITHTGSRKTTTPRPRTSPSPPQTPTPAATAARGPSPAPTGRETKPRL